MRLTISVYLNSGARHCAGSEQASGHGVSLRSLSVRP
jgi:hypothetical protein